MGVLPDPEIARDAVIAGWPADPSLLSWLVGTSHGESGGDPGAIQQGGYGRGLMQIDIGQHPDLASQNLLDPITNLRLAWNIFSERQRSGRDGRSAWYGQNRNPPSLESVKAWIIGAAPGQAGSAPVGLSSDHSSGPDPLATGIAAGGAALGAYLEVGIGLVLLLVGLILGLGAGTHLSGLAKGVMKK